jgi:hypothetical protein
MAIINNIKFINFNLLNKGNLILLFTLNRQNGCIIVGNINLILTKNNKPLKNKL